MLYKTKIKLPLNKIKNLNELKALIKWFKKENKEIYLIGGSIRDLLLNITPKDFDLTTNATPCEMKKILKKYNNKKEWKIIETGIKHGTLTFYFIPKKISFEVTVFRIDGEYKDNRHPDKIKFISSLEEDLKRRDLTINSFAYDLFSNELIMLDKSYLNDLKLKIIRCVGDPVKRYQEDALRMLRTIRFAAQLNFSIESKTYKAITKCKELIKNVSFERIRDELSKILLSSYPEYIKFIYLTGLNNYFLKELDSLFKKGMSNYYKNNFNFTIEVIKNVTNDFILKWTAFLFNFKYQEKYSENIAKKIMERLKFDNKSIIKIYTLIKYQNLTFKGVLKDINFKKKINEIGKENFLDLITLKKAICAANLSFKYNTERIDNEKDINKAKNYFNKIIKNNEPLTIKDLKINGNDLIKLGYKGIEIGNLLNKCLNHVLKNPQDNNKKILINKIIKNN